MDTSNQKECELENGIYVKGVCHYYQVLQELCLKIDLETNEKNAVTGVNFVAGCYADSDPMKFKPAAVGSFYDFAESVSLQVRAAQDPYMVFTYTRENLGTDFTIFLWLSIISTIGLAIASGMMIYFYCCYLKKYSGLDGRMDDDREVRRNGGMIEMPLH